MSRGASGVALRDQHPVLPAILVRLTCERVRPRQERSTRSRRRAISSSAISRMLEPFTQRADNGAVDGYSQPRCAGLIAEQVKTQLALSDRR